MSTQREDYEAEIRHQLESRAPAFDRFALYIVALIGMTLASILLVVYMATSSC